MRDTVFDSSKSLVEEAHTFLLQAQDRLEQAEDPHPMETITPMQKLAILTCIEDLIQMRGRLDRVVKGLDMCAEAMEETG